ncbi:MAG TPA: hypothetical protein VGQ39_17365 [Pyrinomonadaceae bacterium]|jgi:hypothetical protein|nr:hypothetical protein [Pyrinomonadaceae bacterium]
MRELTLKLMLAVAVLSLSLTTARAEVLSTVDVSAPAINCLFDPTCRVEVNDSTETLSIGAGGPNFLQSRTFRGKAGSPAAGLYIYEYRIDLRRAEGILHIPCIDSVSLDFDHIVRTLDLDGDGERGDEVFVVTRGGLGSIGLASAEKSGSTITFRFSDSVCAGGHPNAGESTFFFGLVSTHAPGQTTATILESNGRKSKVYARTPRRRDPLQMEMGQGASVEKPIPIPKRGKTPEVNEAIVSGLFPRPCVDRGGQVTIQGSGFGEAQGSRVVELGGHGIGRLLRVTSWSGKQITAIVPNDRRIEFGQWYYIGLQEQDRHWISNISRTINICRRLE